MTDQCNRPRMVKAGQRDNANDYCPDCGWFDDWQEAEVNKQIEQRTADRIRLAEAMFTEGDYSVVIGKNRELMWLTDGMGKAILNTIQPIPDPFTSADDDYLVLEWSRTNLGIAEQVEMHSKLGHSADYKIGNYARAALEVLDES